MWDAVIVVVWIGGGTLPQIMVHTQAAEVRSA
jgi:hypothetical protein